MALILFDLKKSISIFLNILYNDVPAVLRTVFLVDSSSQCTQLQNIIAIIFVFQGT